MSSFLENMGKQLFEGILPNIKYIKSLGQGAFAQVFLVYDQTQKTQKAVKKVVYMVFQISCFGLCQYEMKMVLNQAKILSSIHHPNIIQFHSCIYDKNEQNVYIFMEYAKEGDLSNLISKTKQQKCTIKQKTIWKIISDIAQALNHLHTNGIIHRDVKPANILIKGQDFKLADMNVSKIKQQGKMTRTNVGTPLYTSPEVAKKLYYNQKCDIWSLGVVAYELCCLQNPFNFKSLHNLDACSKESLIEQKIPLRYSKTLSTLIKGMLKKDPNFRIDLKQILKICQKQGMKLNFVPYEKQVFRTVVFPDSSSRWLNLIAEKKQELDLTIDEILKEESQSREVEDINLNIDQLDDYCLSSLKKTDKILKNHDLNIPSLRMNNHVFPNSVSPSPKHSLQKIKISLHFYVDHSKDSKSSSKDLSSEKHRKIQRNHSKNKDTYLRLSKDHFENGKKNSQEQYGLKFIKLSKNLGKHS